MFLERSSSAISKRKQPFSSEGGGGVGSTDGGWTVLLLRNGVQVATGRFRSLPAPAVDARSDPRLGHPRRCLGGVVGYLQRRRRLYPRSPRSLRGLLSLGLGDRRALRHTRRGLHLAPHLGRAAGDLVSLLPRVWRWVGLVRP